MLVEARGLTVTLVRPGLVVGVGVDVAWMAKVLAGRGG
ncbi:hypothetical protein FHS41_007429 [Streptomyces violarus]|uniref:Uncharacterized protein n=1 Tax=Streptomyces violarus TaxID=67380 RepID=A0A7W4ZYE3_9ACTN|nr:hypothetical protein [Streptomyces violarus]